MPNVYARDEPRRPHDRRLDRSGLEVAGTALRRRVETSIELLRSPR
jgi:hypothetical protein